MLVLKSRRRKYHARAVVASGVFDLETETEIVVLHILQFILPDMLSFVSNTCQKYENDYQLDN